MAGSVNIFLDEGATGNNVEARDGVADHETAVVTFSPDRGTAARLLNAVSAGSSSGLRCTSSRETATAPAPGRRHDRLPRGQARRPVVVPPHQRADHEHRPLRPQRHHTQQDADNIDQSKVDLQYPEASDESGTPSSVTIRDIDEFAIMVDSTVAWSEADSVAQIDTDAQEGPFSRN